MPDTVNILIVEDELIVAEGIRLQLQRLNYNVSDVVSSYENVIKSIERKKPDLILMDIMIPGDKDGIEITSELKKVYNIPIIYLTALSDNKTLERAKTTQPHGYLLKPFDKNELQTGIELALNKYHIEQKMVESERLLSTTLNSIGEAVITTDINLKIQFLNPVAENITGYKLSNIKNKKIQEVLHITDESNEKITTFLKIKDIDADPIFKRENLILTQENGNKVLIDLTTTAILDDQMQRYGFVFVFRDVTERRKNELQIHESLHIEKNLTEISRVFATKTKPDLTSVLSMLAKSVNVNRSYIFEFSKDGQFLSNTYEWCSPGTRPEIDNLKKLPSSIFSWWIEQLNLNEIIIIEDTGNMEPEAKTEQEVLISQDIKAVLVVPFRNSDGNLSGFMGFDDTLNTRKWQQRDIQVLKIVAEMITNYLAKRTAEKALTDSEERFRNLIQSSSDIISILDIDGNISYQSPSIKDILGYEPNELIGAKLQDYIHPEDEQKVVKEFQQFASHKEEKLTVEFKFRKKNGTWAILETYGTKLMDTEDNLHLVLNTRDISERKKTELELRKAKNKAEDMNRLKTTFLANMSHEIRTPLTGIMGFASILENELDDDEYQEMAQRIHISGKRLLDTIDAILDLSKIEANKININLEPVDIIKEANTAINLLQPLANTKNLSINLKTESTVVSSLLDKQLLGQILNNLLGNAIKYSDSGSITIRTGVLEYFNFPKVFIEIEDTGRGISNEFLPYIFDEFRQESHGLARKYEGSGLGLTITKNLTELMDGEISVQSEKNVGSIFTLVFPAIKYDQKVPSDPSGKKRISKKVFQHKKLKMLITDDNADSRSISNRFLKDSFDIVEAESGLEAIELAKNNQFDIILMDINLGEGMNGNETMSRIRDMEQYKDIPIIALTAYAMKGDKDHFITEGFSDYISKPFRRFDIVNTVIKHTKKRSQKNAK